MHWEALLIQEQEWRLEKVLAAFVLIFVFVPMQFVTWIVSNDQFWVLPTLSSQIFFCFWQGFHQENSFDPNNATYTWQRFIGYIYARKKEQNSPLKILFSRRQLFLNISSSTSSWRWVSHCFFVTGSSIPNYGSSVGRDSVASIKVKEER